MLLPITVFWFGTVTSATQTKGHYLLLNSNKRREFAAVQYTKGPLTDANSPIAWYSSDDDDIGAQYRFVNTIVRTLYFPPTPRREKVHFSMRKHIQCKITHATF